jgi:hypothetical protein
MSPKLPLREYNQPLKTLLNLKANVHGLYHGTTRRSECCAIA